MPPPIDRVARHAWIVVHVPEGRDRRFEYGAVGGPDPFSDFTGGDVMLHGVLAGTPSEVEARVACLDEASRFARESHPGYFPIPGPNSNTYIDILVRRCGIPIELPATAIGRDYRGIAGASVTESRAGVQLESVILGLRVGLVDGVEAHLLGFAMGVHFWPPGITLPVNPGRLGFASDGHAARTHAIDRQHVRDGTDGHDVGLASAWMSANFARPIDPAKTGGLEGRGTVGLAARGLYGRTLAYGFGIDFELGVGLPASFAYAAHLYPAGVGWTFGPTGYAGVFAGIGTSGVSTLVPAALELPVEARLEMDVTRFSRIGLRASAAWNAGPAERQRSALLGPGVGEVTFGTFARFGKTRRSGDRTTLGSGTFFALERRELMGSAWIGLSLGAEMDAAQ